MPCLWGDRRVPTRIKMQTSSSQEEKQIQEKQSRHPPKQQLGQVFWHKHWPWKWGKGSFFRGRRETETGASPWWWLCWLHWPWCRYWSWWRCWCVRWYTADGIGLGESQDAVWQSWCRNQATSDHENSKSFTVSFIGLDTAAVLPLSQGDNIILYMKTWRGWGADRRVYLLKTGLDRAISFCLVEGLILFILYMS